jgi:acetyl esterase/lipase
MHVLLIAGFFGLAASMSHSAALSKSEARALVKACRGDIVTLCSGVKRGGGAIAQCLRKKRTQLSNGCRKAIASAIQNRAGGRQVSQAALPADTKVYRDIAYGSDPKQRMDIYVPDGAANAPVIFMVHGGGWAYGSKAASRVVENKLNYWLPKGFIFISVNNRLLPEADPLAQAEDVAAALAAAQEKVRTLGGDPWRFVLMGHSAGAHLVSLLSADPALATRLGAMPWRGTVALDTAAYDVTKIMTSPHHRLYDRAFGKDPEFWRNVSPIAQLRWEGKPMLLVCSSKRQESCPQAEAFDSKAQEVGVLAEVLPVDKGHRAINEDLGKPGSYTAEVDRFVDLVTRSQP